MANKISTFRHRPQGRKIGPPGHLVLANGPRKPGGTAGGWYRTGWQFGPLCTRDADNRPSILPRSATPRPWSCHCKFGQRCLIASSTHCLRSNDCGVVAGAALPLASIPCRTACRLPVPFRRSAAGLVSLAVPTALSENGVLRASGLEMNAPRLPLTHVRGFGR